MFVNRIFEIAGGRSWLQKALIACALGLALAGCGGQADRALAAADGQASTISVALSAGTTSAGIQQRLKAHGDNLVELAQPWPTWSGQESGIRFEDGVLVLPGDGSDLILGVNRFDKPLSEGTTYTFEVDASNPDAAAVLFLFDSNGALVALPNANGLTIARTDATVTFSAPANVAGFYLQVQNQFQAQTTTALTVSLTEGEGTSPTPQPGGPNLINVDGPWPNWANADTGISGSDGAVIIPPVPPDTGNVIGVRRNDTALIAGSEYELAALPPSDDNTAVLLFLFGTNGSVIPFVNGSETSNWLTATANSSSKFVAPEGVVGFAIQVQGGYLASTPATVLPSLKLTMAGDPPESGGGDNGLIELSTSWDDWSGESTGIEFDTNRDALLIPAPAVDANPTLGVHRFFSALEAGTTYRLATGRHADYGTQVTLYLFDENSQLIPIATGPDGETRSLTVVSNEPGSNDWFTAPDNVAGFAIQVQSPFFASNRDRGVPRETIIAPTLAAVTAEAIEPTNPESVSFVAFGDQGTGDDNQQRVADSIELVGSEAPIGFAMLLGDNFYESGVSSIDDPQWNSKFESVYSGPVLSRRNFYAVLGNHDRYSNFQAQIDYGNQRAGSGRWNMPAAYYYRDFGRVGNRPLLRIVFLDTDIGNGLEDEQAQFIADAFSQTNGRPVWKAVAGHNPVRNAGLQHGSVTSVADWLRPALIQAKVDLYLSAHEHNQQLLQVTGEPAYVISGGGGRGLHTDFDRSNPNLQYSAATFGFAWVQANATTMQIAFYDDRGVRGHIAVVR